MLLLHSSEKTSKNYSTTRSSARVWNLLGRGSTLDWYRTECSISSPQTKVAVVSVDGINLSSRFILKEMSIRLENENSYRHFVFNKPADLEMTAKDKKLCKEDSRSSWYQRLCSWRARLLFPYRNPLLTGRFQNILCGTCGT